MDDFILMEERQRLDALRAELHTEAAKEQERIDKIRAQRASFHCMDGTDVDQWRSMRSDEARAGRARDHWLSYIPAPYYQRIDLVDLSSGDPAERETYYVGKHGLEINGECRIIAWQSDIATWAAEADPDAAAQESGLALKLRRRLLIRNRQLESYTDEIAVLDDLQLDEGSQTVSIADPYLLSVLQDERRSHAVSDIIQTIQRNQREIICLPPDQSFAVQGCAGSGKTMVLLHRLSYLLYHFPDHNWDETLIITPAGGYMEQLYSLFNELDLQQIAHATLDELYQSLIAACRGQQTMKAATESESCLNPKLLSEVYSIKFKDQVLRTCRRQWKSNIRRAADIYRRHMSRLVLFSPDPLPTAYGAETYQAWNNYRLKLKKTIYDVEHAESTRQLELEKLQKDFEQTTALIRQADQTCSRAAESVNEWLQDTDAIKYRPGTSDLFLRMADHHALLTLDLRRITNALKAGQLISQDAISRLDNAECLETYNDTLLRKVQLQQRADRIAATILSKSSEPLPSRLTAQQQELASELDQCVRNLSPAAMLNAIWKELRALYKVHGEKYTQAGFHHKLFLELLLLVDYMGAPETLYRTLYIDEAQDINLSEYHLLRQILGDRSVFCLFGDLDQRSPRALGLRSWSQLAEHVPMQLYNLRENYRNTAEITDYCNQRFGLAMTPIGISGPEPRDASLAEALLWLQDKQSSDSRNRCALLLPAGPAQLHAQVGRHVGDICSWHKILPGRISVLTLADCRGLEFDYVAVLTDAKDPSYNYVACTRALHELLIVRHRIPRKPPKSEVKEQKPKQSKSRAD